jgi:OOP family OmpA-OmpF porin
VSQPMRVALLSMAAVMLPSLAMGNPDTKGSSDHPLVSRMPDFYISEFREVAFDAVKFGVLKDGKKVDQVVEGRAWYYRYYLNPGVTPPGHLAILRNFSNALTKAGAEVLYDGPRHGQFPRWMTFRLTKDGRDVWVTVNADTQFYYLTIVETEAMKQVVVADAAAWAGDLRATGKVAIYGINFDTGKSDLKPESAKAVEEIAKLLRQDPSLKLYVVGHTDMVGDPDMNAKLSLARAQAVIASLVGQHGIAAARLVPFGNGPYAPVASNRTEDGRAKNRRVELVDAAAK